MASTQTSERPNAAQAPFVHGFGVASVLDRKDIRIEISSDTIEDKLYANILPLSPYLRHRLAVYSTEDTAGGEVELLSVDAK